VKRAIGAVLVMMIAVVGCGGSKPEPVVDVTSEAEIDLPEPVASEAEITLPERVPYTLSVGDLLTIKFFYYPSYDLNVYVRPDGAVTVPLLGEVFVEGMKPSELEDMIRARYSEVLAEPEVSVIVLEFPQPRAFVFGEVLSPGAVFLKGSMTIVDAIAAAGGPRDTAKMGSVVLIRRTNDGKYVGSRVNIKSILGSEDGENLYLMASDVVYVPRSTIAKVDLFVEQFFSRITPAWIFYIYGDRVLNAAGEDIILGR
jgi:polysaccharide export outer membrane protein